MTPARPPGPKRLAAPPLSDDPPPQGAEARSAFFDTARFHAPVVGVETDSGSFVVGTGDRHLGKSLFVKRSRPEFRVLSRAVTALELLTGADAVAGRTFVDVGANIGTSTVAALVAHRFADAVCCEPEEQNHRLLRANLALNDLEDRAHTLRVGVSDTVGSATLVVHEESGGFSWVTTDPGRIEAVEQARIEVAAKDPSLVLPEMSSVEIETVTLDWLVERGPLQAGRAGLLWIDAEGHEGRILRGARTLIEAGVPIVLEFDPAGQDERGDREHIHEVAEASYTHYVDVRRREEDRSEARFRLRPAHELRDLAERFLSPSGPGKFTDVLLLRLTDEQAAAGADLPESFGKRRRGDQASNS